MRKHTTEEIRLSVENLGYELVGDYVGNKQKIIIIDNDGYFYAVYFNNLKRYTPNRFHKDNPYTIQNLKLWLKLNYNQYELISSDYENVYTAIILKDDEGYFTQSSFRGLVIDGHLPFKFHVSNPYTIQNIKLWCIIHEKSFELISDKYTNNYDNLNWQCLKDGCGEAFESNWGNISQGKSCGYCRGLQVGLSNCLATKRPDLASEWYPSLNVGMMTPHNVSSSSGEEIWWKCKTNPKHEWYATISNRNSKSNKTECPYCSHRLPSEEYNLLVINPTICEEWDYNKNKKQPEEYCPNSGKHAWWKCKICNREWETRIIDRSGKGHGCPTCNESKGEKKIKEWLNSQNIVFIPQKEFDGLLGVGGGLLSYDFYIPKYNLLIEYQGEYHDRAIPNFKNEPKEISKTKLIKQQEHDKRKKEYTIQNNIKLLEIWYWDFDKVEEILEKYLLENTPLPSQLHINNFIAPLSFITNL